SWRDGVQPDVIFRPLHRERGSHRQNSRFRASRRYNKSRTRVGSRVSRDDIQHIAAKFLGNPALAEYLRAVKGADQHDADDGRESIGSQVLRAGHEISSSVLDEGTDFSELFLGFCSCGFDGAIVANVTSGIGGCAT